MKVDSLLSSSADVENDRHLSLGTFESQQVSESKSKLDFWNSCSLIRDVLVQFLKTKKLLLYTLDLRVPYKKYLHTDRSGDLVS
ncbi:hypothetical protein TNCV_4221401 [Trichonephila clavipes]|nr:hypothetical protein TNCV_4221401 [Trichonephila clavipes]